MSIPLEEIMVGVQNRIESELDSLCEEITRAIKDSEIDVYPDRVDDSIKYLLALNVPFEIKFIDENDIPRLLTVDNFKYMDEELGVIPIFSVVLLQILDNGIYVEEDSINFPIEMIDEAVDCFIECYWKKDTLSYEGERMTLKEIRDYSIHYVKHQVVDTVDSNKNSLAKEILCY